MQSKSLREWLQPKGICFSFVRMIHHPEGGSVPNGFPLPTKGHFSLVNQIEGCFSPDAADFDREPVKSTKEKQIFPSFPSLASYLHAALFYRRH